MTMQIARERSSTMFLPFTIRKQIQSTAGGPNGRLALVLLAGTCALALLGVGVYLTSAPLVASTMALADDGEDEDLGAFTCDFTLSGDLPLDAAAPILEEDRV